MKSTTSRPCERIGHLMPSCKGAKLPDGKVFKSNVGHRQLAFYQMMLTYFSVSVIAFSAAVPYN